MKTILCLAAALLVAVCSASTAAEDIKEAKVTKPNLSKIKTGEFWYRFEDGAGKAMGYARIHVEARKAGGLALGWEMRVNFDNGGYEEDRTMVVDGEGKLLSAGYSRGGQLLCEAAREGDKFKGKYLPQGSKDFEPLEAPTAADAQAGLSFILFSGLSHESGAEWAFDEVSERSNFASQGRCVAACKGSENVKVEGKDVSAWRYDVLPENRKQTVTLWVTDKVVRAQWGKDFFQVFSDKPTKDLYQKVEDVMKEVESGEKSRLTMRGDFEKISAAALYDWFTKPELLTKWWPQRAETELKAGGKYHLFWDSPKWTLRGVVKAAEAGKKFEFTWVWDDAPEPERTVTLTFSDRKDGGCTLDINQNPYGDSKEERAARDSVKQGWIFFCNKLRLAIEKEAK